MGKVQGVKGCTDRRAKAEIEALYFDPWMRDVWMDFMLREGMEHECRPEARNQSGPNRQARQLATRGNVLRGFAVLSWSIRNCQISPPIQLPAISDNISMIRYTDAGVILM
jgi:hypothetical protein